MQQGATDTGALVMPPGKKKRMFWETGDRGKGWTVEIFYTHKEFYRIGG